MLSFLKSFSTKVLAAGVSVAMLCATAKAGTINVVNGNFSQTSATASSQFGNYFPGVTVNGWTGTGYDFIFLAKAGTMSGTQADNGGANGQYGNVKLWGPGSGANNGLTNAPGGGNFIALDGDYEQPDAISQTLSGLTVGAATTVSFYYAGAQQTGYTGATTEQLQVSLGNQTLSTPVLPNPGEGFTGWRQANLTFTPTSTTETLTFLSEGTPAGEPPFALLDDVSVSNNVTPEPSSFLLLGTGLVTVGGVVRRRMTRT